jgi:CDP-diacylglycerol--glycerol-3-phosphate 3-phosphatidyltransferase
MTLPNKLTLTRLLAAPLVFLSWYIPFHLGLSPKFGSILIWVLFLVSEVTDILDGHFARTLGQVSDVGKLMDPFSDVFLRVTYFTCFVGAGLMPVWTLVVILWRELAIMFIRMLLAREGVTLAANKGGKLKSALYFVSGFGGLTALTLRAWTPGLDWMNTLELIVALLFVVAALASLISFADYFSHYMKSETHKKFMSE